MRYLLIVLLQFLTVTVFSQSKEFIALENKIQQFIQSSQWDEVLLASTDLISEDHLRGEGYYYTALAFAKLDNISKAKEYLTDAEKLGDAALKQKIAVLKDLVDKQSTIKTETTKINSSGSQKTADDYRKLWQLDKSNLENALIAVDKYIEKEDFVEALAILNDPTIVKEEDAQKLIELINKKPKMVRLNGFNAAIKAADQYFSGGNFQMAISKYTDALGFFSGDKNASDGLARSRDEYAWQQAQKAPIGTVDTYQKYISNYPLGKYRARADQIIQSTYLSRARDYANANQFETAVDFYKKYQSAYPRGPEISVVNRELCDLYFKEGQKYETKKTVSEINTGIELFKNALSCGNRNSLSGKIKTLQSKSKRWSRPDHTFLGWTADQDNLIGLSIGNINTRKLGVYIAIRTGQDIFKELATWSTNNSNSLEESSNKKKTFNNQLYNQQVFATLGVSKKIVHPIWLYAGAGVVYQQQLREFKDSNGNIEYVRNKDAMSLSVNPEVGVRVKLGILVLSYGINKPLIETFTQPYMQHFGAAFSL